jgi:potassium efflux system protein
LRLTRILLRTFLFLSLAIAGTGVGYAQTQAPATAQAPAQPPATEQAAPPPSAPAEQAAKRMAKAKADFTALQESVKQNRDDDDGLVALAGRADELNRSVADISAGLAPRLEQIKARLAELGEPPKDGQPPEADIVANERNALTSERAQLNAVSGEAENLTGMMARLTNEVAELRRQLFAATLLRRTDISASVFSDAGSAFVREVGAFHQALTSWLGFVLKFKAFAFAAAIFMSLATALILLSGSYRLFGAYLQRKEGEEKPSYISRLSVAFWSTLIRTLSLATLLVTSYFFLNSFNVLRPDIAPVVAALFATIGLVYFVRRFTNAVFAPRDPQWRLVRLSNRGATSISACLLAMAIVHALDYFLGSISESMGSPLVLTVVRSWIAALIIGLILIAASFGRPMMAKSRDPDAPGRHWPKGMAIILRVLGAILILAALTGYVGLARFIASQLIFTGAIGVTTYIGLLSGKAISRTETFGETTPGKFLATRFKLGPVVIDQVGLLVGFCIYGVALAAGIPLILLLWGFHIQDLQLIAYRLFTEVRLGGISISLVGIFTGILLFAGCYLLTRWVQRWLDNNVMARSHVDLGVRNSVKTGIGYLGVGIAALIGVSAAGIDLSSFALVASALSVGIGFGLQNIVSNFVSGLILLVERPFKVGDHVVSGTAEGIVKRISVRATEIETFRKQSIIVPNSELINANVGNWTHRNKMGRSEIPVSVSYDSDPQKVMDILLELVNAVPLVLRNPEPHVEFLRFGPYSLDFELRFMLGDMGDGLKVRNDLRIAILKRFRQEAIEIPLPQSDVVFHRQPDTVRPDVEDLVPEVNEDETVETDKIDEDDGRVRRLRGKAAEG